VSTTPQANGAARREQHRLPAFRRVKSYTWQRSNYTRGYDLDGASRATARSQTFALATTRRAGSPSSTIPARAELQHVRLRSPGPVDERGAAEPALRLRLRRVGTAARRPWAPPRQLRLRHDEQSPGERHPQGGAARTSTSIQRLDTADGNTPTSTTRAGAWCNRRGASATTYQVNALGQRIRKTNSTETASISTTRAGG